MHNRWCQKIKGNREGEVAMSVDMQQRQAIHHLQGEVSEADREVKVLVEDYEQQPADLPEQRAVDEAEQALKEARDRLKIKITSDPDLAKLADRIDEAKFKRRDLGGASCRTTWSSTTTRPAGT
jgi:FlaA1/EpsC-like NDP-sugar epimerase